MEDPDPSDSSVCHVRQRQRGRVSFIQREDKKRLYVTQSTSKMPENTKSEEGIVSTGTLRVVGLLRLTSKVFADDIICEGTGGDLYSLATTSEYV